MNKLRNLNDLDNRNGATATGLATTLVELGNTINASPNDEYNGSYDSANLMEADGTTPKATTYAGMVVTTDADGKLIPYDNASATRMPEGVIHGWYNKNTSKYVFNQPTRTVNNSANITVQKAEKDVRVICKAGETLQVGDTMYAVNGVLQKLAVANTSPVAKVSVVLPKNVAEAIPGKAVCVVTFISNN